MVSNNYRSQTMTRTPSKIKMERLRELLKVRPMTNAEIAQKLCLSTDSVYRYLRFMRNGENREIRIAYWERTESAPPVAFYAIGTEKDAKKPRPFNEREQNRRCYLKMKRDDPAKYTVYLERARHKSKVRNRTAKGELLAPADPMLAWIPRRDMREAA